MKGLCPAWMLSWALALPCQEVPASVEVEWVQSTELAEQPRSATALKVMLHDPDDVEAIAAFGELQRLSIHKHNANGPVRGIDKRFAGKPDLFAPLAACQQLRYLMVGYFYDLSPRSLDFIGKLPRLEHLELIGASHLVDAPLVAELAKLQLRRLDMLAARIAPGAFGPLCQLPVLEELSLELPLHVRRADYVHLQRLRQLRTLKLSGIGDPMTKGLEAGSPLPGVSKEEAQRMPLAAELVFGPEAMRALAALPRLRELSLTRTVVDDEVMAEVPAGLEQLEVCGLTGLTPAAVAGLARLERLSTLVLTTRPLELEPEADKEQIEAVERAWAELLPKLPLREVCLYAPVVEELLEALPACRTLRKVKVHQLGHARVVQLREQLPATVELVAR